MGFHEDIFGGRVGKEELEVVKWICLSGGKEWKERVEYRGFPCNMGKVGYGVLIYIFSELTVDSHD